MPPRDPDPYATLGVTRDASLREIARAHRRLAKHHHPDVSGDPEAVTHMRALNEAWRVLSSAELRAAWDLSHDPPGARSHPPPEAAAGWRRASPAGVQPRATPPRTSSGMGGWIALAVASLLLVGVLAAGVAAAMRPPLAPGDNTPGYHGNLD